MARFAPALVVLPLAALAAAGCGGGQSGAAHRSSASLSTRCAARTDAASSGNVLWLGGSRPVVYFVDKGSVLSSHGHGVSLPPFARTVGFRACSTPLVLYTVGSELQATALTGSRGAKTLTLGRNAVVSPNGSIVSYAGSRIRYAGGASFSVHGLPPKWEITSLAVSPTNPHLFLAAAQSPEAGIEMCGKGLGGIYRVSPTGTKTILIDNPCHDHPQAGWSPNGATITYIAGPADDLFTRDSSGGHPRRLTASSHLLRYIWSPDGTRIAFATKRGLATVVAVSNRKISSLGRGAPLAWSPNGHEVAVAASGRPLIEAVSASSGSSRVLLRLPKR